MHITALNEKAMLVKLTTRRANLTRRDDVAEQTVQNVLEDASLTVNSKLFRDQSSPINQIMAEASRVYVYHKQHTHPYVDRGPRILPNTLYMEYTAGMRERINRVDDLLTQHMPHYDTYVQNDIDWRCRQAKLSGKEPRAKVEDYPTGYEFRTSMGFDIQFMPLPAANHFLFDIDPADLAKFEASMADVGKIAVENTVAQMLKPLRHLADVLAVPIGSTDPETGKRMGIFRDSAIENVIEGLNMAKKLVIDPTPELVQTMKELDAAITHCNEHANWLRESPINREAAAKKLAEIANQMSGYMG